MTTIAELIAAKAAKSAPAPVKRSRDDLVWENIPVTDLDADTQALFYAIGKAKSAFEARMAEIVEPPSHLRLVFTYRAGLAIALAPVTKAAGSLAALVARANAA